MRGETLAAVDGTVVLGNEGDTRGRATCSTGGFVHLARFAVVGGSAGLPGRAAALTTGRLVLEALLRVEFLFACGEHEFRSAVLAYQRLVLIHG